MIAAAGALAFGVGMSVLKGNGSGIRDAIGNLSAPWLLLAFIAGAWAGGRRIGRAAVLGALSTLLALGGFYVANAFVLRLGPHPWYVDLRLAFGDGYYFKFGLFSGPVFGALGGLWRRRRWTALGVLVAALLVLEPLAWLAVRGDPASYAVDPGVWAGEAAVGIGACVLVATAARRRRRPPRSPGENAG